MLYDVPVFRMLTGGRAEKGPRPPTSGATMLGLSSETTLTSSEALELFTFLLLLDITHLGILTSQTLYMYVG